MIFTAFDTRALCTEKGYDDKWRRWKFSFRKARCTPLTESKRTFELTCITSFLSLLTLRRTMFRPDESFPEFCPEGFYCQDHDYERNDYLIEDIQCVSDKEVSIEMVTVAEAIPGSPTTGIIHCSKEESVPGRHHVTPTWKGLNLILTEEVTWANASRYTAPTMFIRDQTTPFKFDRALKHGTSIISAAMNLLICHGKLQERRVQFCLELIPKRREFWVIFTYSWFQQHKRSGTISD